jgi:hypothetical protein
MTMLGLGAAVAAGGSALVAPPAMAGVNCASGYHCVFYTDVNSSKHSYFNSDTDFSNDFFSGGNGVGSGQVVNNNTWAASNSSNSGYESHYYDGFSYTGSFLFCVNPGATVHSLPSGLRDRASSMRLRGTTTIHCLSN